MKSGCWFWTGSLRDKRGYGSICLGEKGERKTFLVHRVSSYVFLGTPLRGNLNICHHCDIPQCFNPQHLFSGTHKENTRDMILKGRRHVTIGEQFKSAKLSKEKIFKIRRMRRQGFIQQKIADKFGVDQSVISEVLSGKIWRHVK